MSLSLVAQLQTERDEIVELLEELDDFLEGYEDADHNGTSFVPNEAMSLRVRVREILARVPR